MGSTVTAKVGTMRGASERRRDGRTKHLEAGSAGVGGGDEVVLGASGRDLADLARVGEGGVAVAREVPAGEMVGDIVVGRRSRCDWRASSKDARRC